MFPTIGICPDKSTSRKTSCGVPHPIPNPEVVNFISRFRQPTRVKSDCISKSPAALTNVQALCMLDPLSYAPANRPLRPKRSSRNRAGAESRRLDDQHPPAGQRTRPSGATPSYRWINCRLHPGHSVAGRPAVPPTRRPLRQAQTKLPRHRRYRTHQAMAPAICRYTLIHFIVLRQ